MGNRKSLTTVVAIAGSAALVFILVFGTIRMGRCARSDTESAVRSVGLLYLDEPAGRREQVVEEYMQEKIAVIGNALALMTEEDLSDAEHLRAYQARIKRLFMLRKFAFVDENGLIHTSQGTLDDIDRYRFDYRSMEGPEISLKDAESDGMEVIIGACRRDWTRTCRSRRCCSKRWKTSSGRDGAEDAVPFRADRNTPVVPSPVRGRGKPFFPPAGPRGDKPNGTGWGKIIKVCYFH